MKTKIFLALSGVACLVILYVITFTVPYGDQPMVLIEGFEAMIVWNTKSWIYNSISNILYVGGIVLLTASLIKEKEEKGKTLKLLTTAYIIVIITCVGLGVMIISDIFSIGISPLDSMSSYIAFLFTFLVLLMLRSAKKLQDEK